MDSKISKLIYKEIKKYDNIVLARHIGADPDALGSQFALRDAIKNAFPKKNVVAVGSPAYRFKFMGILDKLEEYPEKALLIVLDTPDIKRIDNIDISKFSYVIKMDHHPFVESFGGLEVIDETSSSSCQLVLEFLLHTKFRIDKSIAEKLYMGIVSDTNRFLHKNTTNKTFELVNKLIELTNINFTELYEPLYLRPFNEMKFFGYITNNMTITENGLAYVKIQDDLLKEYGVDSSSSGNLIGEFSFINEIYVWAFFTEDKKSNLIKVNIRSRGPVINDIASRFGGGGHPLASGAKLTSWNQSDSLIEALDDCINKYKGDE